MRIATFLFFFILINLTSKAQEIWDLERCITHAIANSIDIQQADLSIEDSEVVNKMNTQERLPSLTGSANVFTNFGRTIDPTTNDFVTSTFLSNNFSISGGITLYNGGRIRNNIRRSEIDKLAFVADKNSMTANLTLDVIAAYFEVLLAQDNHSNAEIQLKTINDQLDQMRKLVEAGSRAQFEIFDLEAQQASSEQQLTLAQNRIDLAMLSLKGIINLDPNIEIRLDNPPIDQLVYTDIMNETFNDIYSRVVGARPELQAFDHRIRSGELGIDIAKSSGLPSLTLGGSVSSSYSNQAKRLLGFTNTLVESPVFINGEDAILGVEQEVPIGSENIPYFNQMDNNFSYGFGLQMNIPILDNYTTKGNTERARINLENLKANKEKYIVDLRNLLGQYITDARAAKRNLDASDKVLLAREVAFDNAQKRFDLGAINSFDYISIQDQLNTARTDQIIAKYDYMMKIKLLDYFQGYPVSLN